MAELICVPAASRPATHFLTLTGVETIIMLHKEQPELPIIAMSGGTSHANVYLGVASKIGARRVLNKPFTTGAMLTALSETLTLPRGALLS